VNPYEYQAQEQFSAEATRVLSWLEQRLNPQERRFSVGELSLPKALWMLRTDVIDGLRESLVLIDERRHRPAARLFRDSLEGMDLAFALASDLDFAAKWLPQWYENRSPPHAAIRKWLETSKGKAEAQFRYAYYDQLSKFAHRTYRALLKGYSVGGGDLLVHDRWSPSNLLVLPQTIAAYYAILAELIQLFIAQLVEVNAVSPGAIGNMWEACLDDHAVPRRFIPSLRP
jgi:hypothetical protein